MSGVTLRGFPVESTPDTSAAVASVIKDYMDIGTPGVLKYFTETGPEHCGVPCRRDPCNP